MRFGPMHVGLILHQAEQDKKSGRAVVVGDDVPIKDAVQMVIAALRRDRMVDRPKAAAMLTGRTHAGEDGE